MAGGARATAVGIAQFGLVVVVTRTMSVGAQVALGWILLPEDFGAFAVALAATNIVFAFRELGVGRFLVQRPTELQRHRRPAMATAVGINASLALATSLVARLVASSSHDVVACIDLIALALVVAAPAAVYQAELAVASRYSTIARVSVGSAAARYSVTIATAVVGAGATSLAWGALAAAVFDSCAMRSASRRINQETTPERTATAEGALGVRRFLGHATVPGLWIGVSTVAIAVQTQGDNLVVGWLTDPVTLGVYFFAYQLTVAVSSLFTVGFSNILLPSLATVEDGLPRRAAVGRALRMTGTLGTPVAVAAAFVLPELIVVVWGARWLDAARPAEILALTVGARLLTPVSMAVYQAQGRWKTAAYVGLADGAVVVAAAAVGASQGNVVAVACAVGVARTAASMVETGLASALVGLSPLRSAWRTCMPTIVTLAAAAPWFVYRARYLDFGGPVVVKVLVGAGLAVTLGLLHAIVYGSTWREFVSLLRRPAVPSPR